MNDGIKPTLCVRVEKEKMYRQIDQWQKGAKEMTSMDLPEV